MLSGVQLAQAIDVTGSGKINYLEFLNAFYVVDNNATTRVAEQLWQQICASFYQQKVTLRSALSQLDPESTGKVDAEEFHVRLLLSPNLCLSLIIRQNKLQKKKELSCQCSVL